MKYLITAWRLFLLPLLALGALLMASAVFLGHGSWAARVFLKDLWDNL